MWCNFAGFLFYTIPNFLFITVTREKRKNKPLVYSRTSSQEREKVNTTKEKNYQEVEKKLGRLCLKFPLQLHKQVGTSNLFDVMQ